MLPRVVLGALLVSGVAHAEPSDGIATVARDDDDGADHRVEAVLGTGGAGGRYMLVGEQLVLEVQAFGEADRRGATARIGLARFETLGIEHHLVTGVGLVQASAATGTDPITAPTMLTHTTARSRGNHRFLAAYINDTVRFIRGLDVTGGLVVEQWKNLGGDSTITYGSGPPMDVDTPVGNMRLTPTAAITGHVSARIAVVAQTHRGVHEIGPDVTAGRFAGRARAFTSDLGAGAGAEMSVQPVAPLIATVGYSHTTSMKLAAASLTYSDPRVLTVTTRVDTASRLDALAVRRIRGGFAGFVGVENVVNRRDAESSPRLIHVGLRYASR